jgi:predicted nucleic acid-binding protein
VWVPNASPVIVLAKAGRLGLIAELCDRVLLPEAVALELLAGPADDPARLAVATGWGQRVAPDSCPSGLIEWGLGAGETSVLAVALQHPPCTVLLDDASARAAARTFGVSTLGTLGILVRARLRGLIASAAQALQDVRDAGLYLDDATIAAALRQIGEDWRP